MRLRVAGPVFVFVTLCIAGLAAASGKQLEKEVDGNGELVTGQPKEKTSAVEGDGPSKFGLFQFFKHFGSADDGQKTTVESGKKVEPGKGFQDISLAIMSLMAPGKKNEEQTQKSLNEIVAQVTETTEQGALHEETSFREVLDTLREYSDVLQKQADEFTTRIDFSKLTPAGLKYYLEYEDERKNPSWKNRVHRFCPGIDINKVEELNDMLNLATLSYADTAEEIREGLLKASTPSDMVYCDLKSEAGKPAHFIAVRTNQPSSVREPLEVFMVVRGTKSLLDVITDILCQLEDYRKGKAHQFILRSGHYLFKKHQAFLEDLARKAGRSKIKLTLVGHSLGAGAASIAGIEFHDLKNFQVQVYGFGCPALLSKELAEKATFITTVINDSDAIPRSSAATVINLLRSLTEFDWLPYSRRDFLYTVTQLQKSNPLFTDAFIAKVLEIMDPFMETHMGKFIERNTTTSRIPAYLCPPGKLIHLYHDGLGISGSYVPSDFFQEIDVTRGMIDDHLIFSGYQKAFLDIMRRHKQDHHFRFETLETDA